METKELQKAFEEALAKFNSDQTIENRREVIRIIEYALLCNRGKKVRLTIGYGDS